MRAFTYTRAQDAPDAVARFRPGSAYLGGGTNLVDLMRLGSPLPAPPGPKSARISAEHWCTPRCCGQRR